MSELTLGAQQKPLRELWDAQPPSLCAGDLGCISQAGELSLKQQHSHTSFQGEFTLLTPIKSPETKPWDKLVTV